MTPPREIPLQATTSTSSLPPWEVASKALRDACAGKSPGDSCSVNKFFLNMRYDVNPACVDYVTHTICISDGWAGSYCGVSPGHDCNAGTIPIFPTDHYDQDCAWHYKDDGAACNLAENPTFDALLNQCYNSTGTCDVDYSDSHHIVITRGQCIVAPKPDDTICTIDERNAYGTDLNDKCVESFACQNGQCSKANRKDCNDGSQCTSDWCDYSTGECYNSPIDETDPRFTEQCRSCGNGTTTSDEECDYKANGYQQVDGDYCQDTNGDGTYDTCCTATCKLTECIDGKDNDQDKKIDSQEVSCTDFTQQSTTLTAKIKPGNDEQGNSTWKSTKSYQAIKDDKQGKTRRLSWGSQSDAPSAATWNQYTQCIESDGIGMQTTIQVQGGNTSTISLETCYASNWDKLNATDLDSNIQQSLSAYDQLLQNALAATAVSSNPFTRFFAQAGQWLASLTNSTMDEAGMRVALTRSCYQQCSAAAKALNGQTSGLAYWTDMEGCQTECVCNGSIQYSNQNTQKSQEEIKEALKKLDEEKPKKEKAIDDNKSLSDPQKTTMKSQLQNEYEQNKRNLNNQIMTPEQVKQQILDLLNKRLAQIPAANTTRKTAVQNAIANANGGTMAMTVESLNQARQIFADNACYTSCMTGGNKAACPDLNSVTAASCCRALCVGQLCPFTQPSITIPTPLLNTPQPPGGGGGGGGGATTGGGETGGTGGGEGGSGSEGGGGGGGSEGGGGGGGGSSQGGGGGGGSSVPKTGSSSSRRVIPVSSDPNRPSSSSRPSSPPPGSTPFSAPPGSLSSSSPRPSSPPPNSNSSSSTHTDGSSSSRSTPSSRPPQGSSSSQPPSTVCPQNSCAAWGNDYCMQLFMMCIDSPQEPCVLCVPPDYSSSSSSSRPSTPPSSSSPSSTPIVVFVPSSSSSFSFPYVPPIVFSQSSVPFGFSQPNFNFSQPTFGFSSVPFILGNEIVTMNQTSSAITLAICGNKTQEDGEECDDGNLRDFDGCSADCLLERGFCGDGVIEKLLGEQCEATLMNSDLTYTCNAQCRFQSSLCGNGSVDGGEECDEGEKNSNLPGGRCRKDCSFGRCGDFVVDAPTEACDDGNKANGDGCNSNCQPERAAGNGLTAQVFDINQQVAYQQPSVLPAVMAPEHSPVGQTGPASVAMMAAGAAGGVAYVRRKKRQ